MLRLLCDWCRCACVCVGEMRECKQSGSLRVGECRGVTVGTPPVVAADVRATSFVSDFGEIACCGGERWCGAAQEAGESAEGDGEHELRAGTGRVGSRGDRRGLTAPHAAPTGVPRYGMGELGPDAPEDSASDSKRVRRDTETELLVGVEESESSSPEVEFSFASSWSGGLAAQLEKAWSALQRRSANAERELKSSSVDFLRGFGIGVAGVRRSSRISSPSLTPPFSHSS